MFRPNKPYDPNRKTRTPTKSKLGIRTRELNWAALQIKGACAQLRSAIQTLGRQNVMNYDLHTVNYLEEKLQASLILARDEAKHKLKEQPCAHTK